MAPSASVAYGSFDVFDNAFNPWIDISRDNNFRDDPIDTVDSALMAPDGNILNLVEVDDDTKHDAIAESVLSHVVFRGDPSYSLAAGSADYANNDDINPGPARHGLVGTICRRRVHPKSNCRKTFYL